MKPSLDGGRPTRISTVLLLILWHGGGGRYHRLEGPAVPPVSLLQLFAYAAGLANERWAS